jgi:hypothetical protein
MAFSGAYCGTGYVLRLARPMTPEERQALREKHKPMDDGDGGFYCNYCREEDNGDAWYGWAMGVEWPCDVIKVLDAYEELYDDNKKMSQALSVALGLSQSLAKMIP